VVICLALEAKPSSRSAVPAGPGAVDSVIQAKVFSR
jgi:hypothetical protein